MGAPVLVTELSHPKERVSVTTFYNTSIVLRICRRCLGDLWMLPNRGRLVLETSYFGADHPLYLPRHSRLFLPRVPALVDCQGKTEEAKAILTKYHGEMRP